MIPQDLHFGFQSAVYLIFLCPLLILVYLHLFFYRKRALERFAFKENLPKLIFPRSTSIYFLKVAFFCIAWVLLTFSLMQPKGNGYYPNKNLASDDSILKQEAHDIIFLIDASASMSIVDSSNHKTRLEFAKEIVDETSSFLSGENASLYAFTSIATKMSSLTPDLFFVRLMLRELTINEGGVAGTDFTKTLETIHEKYLKSPASKLTTLIILSDGGDTSLIGLSAEEKKQAINRIVNTLGDLNHSKITVFTIGVGSAVPSLVPNISYLGKEVDSGLENALLEELAKKGNGNYYQANDFTAIDLSKELIKNISKDKTFSKEELKRDPKDLIVYQELYKLPLGFAILLLIFYFFFPNRSLFSKILTSFLLFHMHLPAALENELQTANYFFEADDLVQAEKKYQDLLEKNLTGFEKAVVLYNLGTLYLHDDKPKKASDAFELISFSNDLPIFLKRRIKTNLGLAKYREALLTFSEHPDDNSIEKTVYLLLLSEKTLKSAIEAACLQDKLEGRDVCVTPPDLMSLANAVQEHLTEVKKLLKGELPTDLTLFSFKQFQQKTKEIKTLADDLKIANINDLKKLLEYAVQLEQETLIMTRQLEIFSDNSKAELEALKIAQTDTLNIADRYLREAYTIQKLAYDNRKCQKKPWNEILPLYNKGYKAALEALDGITLAKKENLMSYLSTSSYNQEEAIKYWKMANSKATSEEKQEEKRQQEKKEDSKQRPEKSKNSGENALQLLQDMQAEDKQIRKTYPKSLKQEETRPW